MFASIHVPDFIVEAVIRRQPELREKPAAILDGKPPLSIVVGLNEAARAAGIEPGMTKFQAEQFPGAVVRQRSMSQETAAQAALLDSASAFSPRVEDTAQGVVTLDIEGLERLFGSAVNLAENLARHVAGAGMAARIALASNPDAAICAARARRGITIIEHGREAAELEPFPIDILPLDDETHETLRCWGIRNFGELAKLPAKELSQRLGQQGIHLHRLARGRAIRPLKPQPPSFRFEESMELDYSIATLEPLTFILNRLCDALFHRLRSRALAAREIDLTLQRERPHAPFVVPLRLPLPVQKPRVVTKLFMLELEARPPGAPVVGVHMEAKPTRPRIIQSGLFTPLSPEPEQLELTLARIAGIVGSSNVGSPELENTHARDRFRMKRFGLEADLLWARSPTARFSAKVDSFHSLGKARGQRPRPQSALRVFRPPLEATVQTQNDVPVWIGFTGVHGPIKTAAGPWRSSGDWWNGRHWSREEWDVAVERLLIRIYRDILTGRWYAEGIYD
jgi:protein ImuB